MSFADLDRLGVIFRPISNWPGTLTRNRRRSPFRSAWGKTVSDLTAELKAIDARQIVLEMALHESDITIDGSRPRANAVVSHPGVVLSFESRSGPLRFAADAFTLPASSMRRFTSRRASMCDGLIPSEQPTTNPQSLAL